jgi:hypothetical protein
MASFPAKIQTKGHFGGRTASPWIVYTKSTPLWILIVEKHATFGQTTGCLQTENLISPTFTPLPKIKALAAKMPEQFVMSMLMTCSISLYIPLHMISSMNYMRIFRV